MLLFTSLARREGGFLAPLVLAGEPVLTAVEDEPYDGFTLTASGGLPPYAYGVHSGSLPTGITLDAGTGEVSGTPTDTGTFLDIVLKVTDDANNEAFLDPFTLEVSAPPGSIAIVNGGFEAGDLSVRRPFISTPLPSASAGMSAASPIPSTATSTSSVSRTSSIPTSGSRPPGTTWATPARSPCQGPRSRKAAGRHHFRVLAWSSGSWG